MPMWAKTTNCASHLVVAIAHKQKRVVRNATAITGIVAAEPSCSHQWYQKGPSSERIAPGNPNFEDIPLDAILHMMPPATGAASNSCIGANQREIGSKGEEEVDPPGVALVDWCTHSDGHPCRMEAIH